MTEEQADKLLQYINNPLVQNKESKLLFIMELLHDNHIGKNKAFELCEKWEIFSENYLWINYDAVNSKEWKDLWK